MAQGWRAKYGLPGVWCAFVKDGKVVACVAEGYRNLETKAPADVRDHLNVGSVSKVVTGSIAAVLVAKGVISYETTVGEVFPELSQRYPQSPLLEAKVRQLLTHTAGLPHALSRSGAPNGTESRQRTLSNALRLQGLEHPGAKYLYSNVGPLIAVAMAERRTGRPYETFLQGDEGRAIGLSSARMLDSYDINSPEFTQPYYVLNGVAKATSLGELRLHPQYKYDPSGGCSLTLPDLCGFVVSTLSNNASLAAEIYAALVSRDESISEANISLASWEVSHSSPPHLFHDGITERGEYCYVSVWPTQRRGAVFYTNAYRNPTSKLSEDQNRTMAQAVIAQLADLIVKPQVVR